MEDLFRSYWWLLFPLGWFVVMGWSSWMDYRRHHDRLSLLRTYAEKGQEPPAELLQSITRNDNMEAWGMSDSPDKEARQNNWPWPANVALFTVLAAGFGYASWADFFGAGEAFTIVTFVMGAMAIAFLIGGIFSRRPRA